MLKYTLAVIATVFICYTGVACAFGESAQQLKRLQTYNPDASKQNLHKPAKALGKKHQKALVIYYGRAADPKTLAYGISKWGG